MNNNLISHGITRPVCVLYFLRLLLSLEVDGVAELGVQLCFEVGHLLFEGDRLSLGDLDLDLNLLLSGVQFGLNLILAQVDENLANLVWNLQCSCITITKSISCNHDCLLIKS